MEQPECPVCLQSYDWECTLPRVLTCGHTACETCLSNLPEKFPLTIRCPACTVLVKYPQQGPSALPKNIDLLRFVDPTLPKPNKNPKNRARVPEFDFIPRTWSDEFYSFWKQHVLSYDAVVVEEKSGEDGGLRFGCLRETQSQRVSIVKVGSLLSSGDDGDSVFKYSYFVRVIYCLSGIREEVRDELGLILGAASKQSKFCKILGLWGDLEDGFLCLVCETLNQNGSLDFFRDGDGFSNNKLSHFAMMSMEICEALIDLNKQGLIVGCLSLSCFHFDDFGHLYIDVNNVLVMQRRVSQIVAEVGCVGGRISDKDVRVLLSNLLESNMFLSPEVLYELLKKEGIQMDCGESRDSVGYGSDVWSIACTLLALLTGKQFTQGLVDHIHCVNVKGSEDNGLVCLEMYMTWMEQVVSLLENKFGSEYKFLSLILCQCLNFDPVRRPLLCDVWKCIRKLIIKPEFDEIIGLDGSLNLENKGHCLVLGELCWLPNRRLVTWEKDELLGVESSEGVDIDHGEEARVVKDLVEGLSRGHIKSRDMQGHHDCITGLVVGGGFLFSSSFDKSIRVWSLQDFSHVHTFKGHEHKVMAMVYVDEEQPLCISGDSGGGIFLWSIDFPMGQEPLKKWHEQKDWRYSGIHALTVSGRYLYTGSGDKTIKAWSLMDGTLSCTMSGHKSVVSTLAVCNGVLYSGSWDGTIRLWSLSDNSLLAVLGEDSAGTVSSVLSLTAIQDNLVASYESGSIKVWRNDTYMKSMQLHKGSIFAIYMAEKWLFTGGWDKTVILQELKGDELDVDTVPIGSIPCGSVITALLYWQGKLFVGCADRTIKVFYYGK